jgi:cytochrome oxidase Cu insertion factor (SCO1/SenC/PrrC family)
MKKGLLTFVVILFAFSAFSQYKCRTDEDISTTVLTKSEVGDFTVTDSDGNTWNLYDLLDQGRTVFLDLFFTT